MHLDLDAFFAAVEQRDKPSLRGKPVIVGGLGGRGVVSTASYEARAYGAHSAMPTAEARRRCPPGTAFLFGRFDAYRASSEAVMGILREISPLVEQISVDEAFVDLSGVELSGVREGWNEDSLRTWGRELLDQIAQATGGLTASIGIATSKMMAKLASEMDKPHGVTVIAPGTEVSVLHPMSVRAVVGVGPATAARLHSFGVDTVGELARVSLTDLVSIFGTAQGTSLHELSHARDDRAVVPEREVKSISVEETFAVDIADRSVLVGELDQMAQQVAGRMLKGGVFARTITVKARQHDFSTSTKSGSLPFATGDVAIIRREARRLLGALDVSSGLRLLGLGVSGLTEHAQEELMLEGESRAAPQEDAAQSQDSAIPGELLARRQEGWRTGQDVRHREHGTGWVWGAGRGLVTVRFEGPLTGPGPIRTFAMDDPELTRAEPPQWRPAESAAGAEEAEG